MKSNAQFSRAVIWAALSLSLAVTPAAAQTFTDHNQFQLAATATVTITFEAFATQGGQAGAVRLAGTEFGPAMTLKTAAGSPPEDGLFVGIPDPSIPGGNNANFFAADFIPVSGAAVLSPENVPVGSPDGALIVNFTTPTNAVGGWFLDAESFPSSIEAFDGPDGTGASLGKVIVQNRGDDSRSFAGLVARGIRSAVFVLGGDGDGVGLDDLEFGAMGISVDIKPGSYPNSLNIDGRGVIPVAILGSADFAPTEIDPSTLTLNGSAVRLRGNRNPQCSVQDVSGDFTSLEGAPDGYPDLLCRFIDDPGQWTPGATRGWVTGNLYNGVPVWGSDSIRIVNRPAKDEHTGAKGDKDSDGGHDKDRDKDKDNHKGKDKKKRKKKD